jgi:hypothetical protein
MVLTSSVRIAVNRIATYGPAKQQSAISIAVERPALSWSFPAGDTSQAECLDFGHGPNVNGSSITACGASGSTPLVTGNREFLLLFNPSTSQTAQVLLTEVDTTGRLLHRRAYILLPCQRLSLDMNLLLPLGRHATMLASSNGVPFVAEQSIFFNNGLGGATGPGVALP